MEFEDVNEHLAWEAQRVAAAFGIQEIVPNWYSIEHNFFGQTLEEVAVTWEIEPPCTHWTSIQVWGKEDCAMVQLSELGWGFTAGEEPDCNRVLSHGLYRLDFEDEAILSQLPLLSAHEKLELRLSMPREFWPQKWLNEDIKQDRDA